MRSAEQIVEFISERIGHIYFRPLMYGGDAMGVDTILHYYHELWSFIFDQNDEYRSIRSSIENGLNCGSAIFSTKFKMDHPNAEENETAIFSVKQWMKISERMKIYVPYEKIRNDLRGVMGSTNINRKLFS